MLGKVFYSCRCRSFSKSSVWRDIQKVKPNEVSKPSEPTSTSSQEGIMDFTPSKFEEKILVWSGKYKSKESIPKKISRSTIENAKSRFRIRFANALMIGSLALAGFYVYYGKQRQKSGDTIMKRRLEEDAKIIEEARKSRQK